MRNAAAWTNSEHVIRDTQGDILLIFDCCFAGILLDQNVRSWPCYPTRRFECLAACHSQQTTRFPGKSSFTSALIWALTELGKTRKRFTTLELQTKIMNEAPEFPKGQFVPLLERGEPCDQRLVLAPQSTSIEPTSPASTASNYLNEPLRNYMDLRFWFPSRPNEEHVANLAKRLKQLMLDGSIGARRIRLEGLTNIDLEPHEKHIARVAVNKWKSVVSWGSATTATLDPDTLSSGSRTRPPSVFSIPENTHSAIKYDQTTQQSTLGSDGETSEIPRHHVKTDFNSDLDSNSYVARFAALTALLRRFSQCTKFRASRRAALTILGVLSLGFGVWYTCRLRPFSLR